MYVTAGGFSASNMLADVSDPWFLIVDLIAGSKRRTFGPPSGWAGLLFQVIE
jgi:hypothetical protein